MKKQIIASALCTAMCLAATPTTAFADNDAKSRYVTTFDGVIEDPLLDYVEDDTVRSCKGDNGVITNIRFYTKGPEKGTLVYTGYGVFDACKFNSILHNNEKIKKVVIENQDDTHTFTAISGFEYECIAANEIVFPDTITEIGDNAFCQIFINVNNIILPANLTKIGAKAFEGSHIKNIVLPESLTEIGDRAFWNCDLSEITVNNKDCIIAADNNTLGTPASDSSEGTLIKCYTNSTAHEYALKNGYHFELLDKPEGLLYGDANMDGAVTWSDVMAVLQYVANEDKYPLTAMGKINADCYNVGDGITGNDANAITDYLTEGINWLPKPAMN